MPISLRPLFALLLALHVSSAFANDTPDSLRNTAKDKRAAADTTYKQAQRKCAARFFVNACLAKAHDQYLSTIEQARTLEAQAAQIILAKKAEQARQRNLVLPEPKIAQPSVDDEHDLANNDARAQRIRQQRHEQQQKAEKFAAQMQQREEKWRQQQQQRKIQSAQERAQRARQKRARYDDRLQKYQLRQNQTAPSQPDASKN